MAPIADFHAVIPAGGAGTRLWPLSRAGHPKFLLDLTGAGRTLLQQTWDRLVPVAGASGISVVTGPAHGSAVQNQLPDLSAANLLIEPGPRDSMAAIGLAAALVAHREGPDAILGSFAADHVIDGQSDFETAIRDAVEAARAGHIVTIGMRASSPSTAFGYIRAGDALGAVAGRAVAEFVEKPDAQTAAEYVDSGAYFWNAGMFIFRTGVLLNHLAQLHPRLHAGLSEIAAAWDTSHRDEVLAATWPSLTKIAIDHAIAEPVAARGGVAVVPADFGWDDVGDWAALSDLVPGTTANKILTVGKAGPDPIIEDGAANLVVPGAGRQVVVLGLDDVVVVDTDDAVLITSRERAQEVKGVVDSLRARGSQDLL